MVHHVGFALGKKDHVTQSAIPRGQSPQIKQSKKMADWRDSWISGVLLVVCLSLTPCVGDGGSCLELGFSSNLLCSSCRELKEFSLGALEADCKSCCQAEGVASDDKVCK